MVRFVVLIKIYVLMCGSFESFCDEVYLVGLFLFDGEFEVSFNVFGFECWKVFVDWFMVLSNLFVLWVVVNCFWYYVFGLGIVIMISDFGVVGVVFIYLELFDWLVVEFMSFIN